VTSFKIAGMAACVWITAYIIQYDQHVNQCQCLVSNDEQKIIIQMVLVGPNVLKRESIKTFSRERYIICVDEKVRGYPSGHFQCDW
jgi:hypothetical protein